MHYSKNFIGAAALAVPLVFAQSLDDIPACALKTTQEGFANAGCALTDYKCLCSATPFISALKTDLEKACSADDYEKTVNFAKELCSSVGIDLALSASSPSSSDAPSAASTAMMAATSASSAALSASSAASDSTAAASSAVSSSCDASSSSYPFSATESSAMQLLGVSSAAATGNGTVAQVTYTHTLTHPVAIVAGSGNAQATAADTAAMSQVSTGTYTNGSYANGTNGSVATGGPTMYAASGSNGRLAWEWTAGALIFGAVGAWGML